MTRAPFDVTDPLPLGRTTLIEASAGTGKTYALTALAVRLVAEEDLRIDRILLVTFTRAATAELRDRVRTKLQEALQHLEDGCPADEGDPVLVAIGACDAEERARRLERLRVALRDYDTASISTIHGFCSQIRAGLGIFRDEYPDAVPQESEAEVIRQVCADRFFALQEAGTPLGAWTLDKLTTVVAKVRTLAECAVDAESAHSGVRPDDAAAVEFVRWVAGEVDRRLDAAGALSYRTLVTSVRDLVVADADLAAVVGEQFDAALIDEFQDTDAVQWAIFERVFASRHTTLVLVGDPKQAIYGFRGGDVFTYLDVADAAEVRVLGVNQRSDPAVVAAMNAMGEGQTFGERIAYERVAPSERHRGRRLVRPDGTAAPGVRVRMVVDPTVVGSTDHKIPVGKARRRIAADLADVVADLVAHAGSPGHRVEGGRPDDGPIRPGDVAVLVGSRSHGPMVAEALAARGVPAVLRLADSVAESEAAGQWRTLLEALDRPASVGRATAAALSWFFGWDAPSVARAMAALDGSTEPAALDAGRELVALQHELQEWRELLVVQGVPAVLGRARRRPGFTRRVLGQRRGERDLTDLEHVAELLHTTTPGPGRGISPASALLALDNLAGGESGEVAADALQRRIDSDAGAVEILSAHSSKGLEFKVVLLPFLWSDAMRTQASTPYSFHHDGRHHLDLSSKGPDARNEGKERKPESWAPDPCGWSRDQACGDQQRLTYVAATRAQHQLVVWWAAGRGKEKAGLGRLLFGRPETGEKKDAPVTDSTPPRYPAADAQVEFVRSRFAHVPEIEVDEVGPIEGDPTRVRFEEPPPAALAVARLDRPLHRAAERLSFSGLSRRAGGHGHGAADPDDPTAGDSGADDELPDDGTSAAERPAAAPSRGADWERVSAYEGLGGGVQLGNVVHRVLELTDFTDSSLADALQAQLVSPSLGEPVTDAQRGGLAPALVATLTTPLGPDLGGITLSRLARRDRLDELDFALLMHPNRFDPGGVPRPSVSAGDLGRLVAEHTAGPIQEWARRLERGLAHVELDGLLVGGIDLVLRTGPADAPRFSVVDYKTNFFGTPGATDVLANYHPAVLVDRMAATDYPLQALLYTVVLHRYLRGRLPGYRPEVHLGPAGYLFVRGMAGPATPTDERGTPAGVFTWHLPVGLVEATDRLLAGAEVAP